MVMDTEQRVYKVWLELDVMNEDDIEDSDRGWLEAFITIAADEDAAASRARDAAVAKYASAVFGILALNVTSVQQRIG